MCFINNIIRLSALSNANDSASSKISGSDLIILLIIFMGVPSLILFIISIINNKIKK